MLAAIDSTPRAGAVAQIAVDFANQFGASLVFLRAVEVPPEFPPAAHAHPDVLEPKLLADAEGELRDFAAKLNAKPTIRVIASHEPWRTIIEEAIDDHVDMIVVGSHGYHGLDRVFATNAAHVADRAKCLVVVVHKQA